MRHGDLKEPPVEPNSAAVWRDRAVDLRADQRLLECCDAITHARRLAPNDAGIAFLYAQARFELGLPAASDFAAALRLNPGHVEVLRNLALSLTAEGRAREGRDMLAAGVRASPGWLDGQRVLASLRWIGGEVQTYDSGYAEAVRARPTDAGLWLGWFGAVAQHRDWTRANAVLEQAEKHIGQTLALLSARVFVASESGDLAVAEALLDRLAPREDAFLKLARIRLHLHRGEAAAALLVAEPLTRTAIAGQIWPYVSTCWRLLGDGRADWLDGDPRFVRQYDVSLSSTDLTELAALLRALHTAEAPYAEQSVRLGTQTDRSVLLRHEPVLQRARIALMEVVCDYISDLPASDTRHPLLSQPRSRQKIAGSWSVRLGAGGFNVTHAHPQGWISSAFYVSLPSRSEAGPAPAGHFHYGAPPAELGLDLPPYKTLAPAAGRLVLFPSTLWHGTAPIIAGERLNIAFDVAAVS